MDSSRSDREIGGGGRPSAGSSKLPDRTVEDIRGRLLRHFDVHARDLPWRRTDDPYRIWVSEIMLQQTRVETVVPYYERWMERFPSVERLAEADLDEVLKSWEGLGYYRRARFLHRAAGVVRDRHGGELPDTAEGLRELPGIGAYTAGAVASIAFRRCEPAVDGNVRRVLSRLFDLPDPTPAELRGLAARLVDPDRPGDFNQAVMELGATICTPRSPDCEACPVADFCRARALGVEERRPLPKKRPDVPEIEYGVAVLVRRPEGVQGGGPWEALLVRRPENGMLGGLWEFPSVELSGREDRRAGAERAAALAGVAVDGAAPVALESVPHTYSHLRARYHPFLFDATPEEPAPDTGGHAAGASGVRSGADGSDRREHTDPTDDSHVRWVDPAGLAEMALPRAQRRIAREVVARLS